MNKEKKKEKEDRRPEHCKHPFGARCIYGKNDYDWNVECKTCTKWNKKLQVSNFKEEEITEKALRRYKILRIILFGILLIFISIGAYFGRHAQGIW